MTDLLVDLGFLVLDRVVDPADVVRAFSSSAERLRVIPRRLALAETIHNVDENGYNETLLAILHHADKTLIAKPASFSLYGIRDMEVALSKHFGSVGCFHSYDVCPSITRYRNGQLDGEITESSVRPKSGLFGQTRPIEAGRYGDIMRVTLAGYVGAPWEAIFPRLGGTAELWQLPG